MAIITNQAQLSYNNTVVNSNIAVGEIVDSVAMTKTAVMDDYSRGDDVTYIISIVNSEATDLTGVNITDDLGGYTFGTGTVYPLDYVPDSVRMYINGVLQQTAPAVTAGPPLAFSGITVPANGNVMLVYEASVNRFAPLAQGSTINNTATITTPVRADTITASETVTAEAAPELTISKSMEPTVIPANGAVTYTFLIQNSGNRDAEAADNVAVSDTFLPVLSNISVTLNGTALTSPAQYTYDAATGAFRTVEGAMTVPAATYTQDPATGAYVITPGVSRLVVSGTV